jgi:hypothetical protein
MANGTRPFPLLIALVVGAAVGWFVGHSTPAPKPPEPVHGNHLMKVGPAAAMVGAAIQKDHMVFWQIRGPAKKLQIHFRVEGFPPEAKGVPPFEGGLTPDGKEQLIECEGTGVCKSGAVNSKLIPVPEGGLYYKYLQTLIGPDGKEDTQDAGIIIER